MCKQLLSALAAMIAVCGFAKTNYIDSWLLGQSRQLHLCGG